MELLDEEKERILKGYTREIKILEEALEETSELISAVTHYAGIVSFMEWHDKLFYRGISRILEHPEFHDFEKVRVLFRIIEDKKRFR
jgi:transcriptional regulator of heat shock response